MLETEYVVLLCCRQGPKLTLAKYGQTLSLAGKFFKTTRHCGYFFTGKNFIFSLREGFLRGEQCWYLLAGK